MTTPLGVGIVGGGYGQHVLVPAFQADGRVSVQALCASTEARARSFAERLSVPHAYGDWRQLVHDPAVQIVAVSVPPPLQPEIVTAAAAAGKHVLAEKPLAMTAADAGAMVESVRRSGVVGTIDFEFRELAAWQRMRDMLADGEIGRLRQVYFSWRIETFVYRENKASWKRDALSGGGALNLFGSHAIDSVHWGFGRIHRLAARLFFPAPGAADSRLEALMELADGPTVSLSIAADAPGGSGYRIEVYGENGALVLENRTADYASGFTLQLASRGGVTKQVPLVPLPAGTDGRITATGSLIRRFIDAIQGGEGVSPNFEDGFRVQQVMDAFRQADRSGTWQTLN